MDNRLLYAALICCLILVVIITYAVGYNHGESDATHKKTVGKLVVDEGKDKILMTFIFDDVPIEEILAEDTAFIDIERKQA